jgi:hypothetical protein
MPEPGEGGRAGMLDIHEVRRVAGFVAPGVASTINRDMNAWRGNHI